MKLQEVLSKLHMPVGLTTLIAAPDSIEAQTMEGPSPLDERIESVRRQQERAGSDASWWGYESQLTYLKTLRYLKRAAEITGPDNLPDVELPNAEGVLMDSLSKLEQFGRTVLAKALETTTVKGAE